jgi:MFS transporter, SP family, arabinose:H+ symporter
MLGNLSRKALADPYAIHGRRASGLAIGADSAIATAYIAEFAPRGRRGR